MSDISSSSLVSENLVLIISNGFASLIKYTLARNMKYARVAAGKTVVDPEEFEAYTISMGHLRADDKRMLA
jgi:hypothetical protein